jgi:hypothetical protein
MLPAPGSSAITTASKPGARAYAPHQHVSMIAIVHVLTSLQVDSPISYLIAFLLPALDAILPVLPSETA